MNSVMIREGSLVLYKNRPARVRRAGEKLEIELEEGEIKVRPKDVVLLHPGPLHSLSELQPQPCEVQTAWELLAGCHTALPELAELMCGDYTPSTAWSAWQWVADGLYFWGVPEDVTVCSPQDVAQKQAAREAEAAEKRAWKMFLEQVQSGHVPVDARHYLRDVQDLALGQSARGRLLRELGRDETPENAHALLLELGCWTESVNPYPRRFGLISSQPEINPPECLDEVRLDLTHLPAFAIDDEGTETPDDAVSLEGRRLWVHVADAAAMVRPDSALDLEARARGASVHLPEGPIHMLPRSVVQRLGLGLMDISPALSFGLDMDAEGQVTGVQVALSWVRATRLTYEEAQAQLDARREPLNSLYHLAQTCQARRRANHAIFIEFPEVKVQVDDGQVSLRLLPPLKSRSLVQEAMIAAGEALAGFALEHDLPFPFDTQESPDVQEQPASLSGMFALRRTLKRSQYKNIAAPHAGLGLAAYVQLTSPLRRYLDLVAHQQLRAFLRGEAPLEAPQVMERIGAVEAVVGSVRQAEQLSSRHWTLVYLLRHPDWRGEGILVEKRGQSGKVIIPALGLEAQVHLPTDAPLDSSVHLALRQVKLAHLDAIFRVVQKACQG